MQFNPFTAIMSNENDQSKAFLSSFSHWRVKGLLPKGTALNVDVTGPETIVFAGASMHFSARTFYRLWQ